MNNRERGILPGRTTVVFVAGFFIALFLALPRLAIILYVRSLPWPGVAGKLSWMDFVWKCSFSFLAALLFLWLNTARGRLIPGSKLPDLSSFWQRMVLNLLLFVLVKLTVVTWVPETPGFAFNERFAGFMLNISLVLECCLCMLIGEGYMLLVKNQEMKMRNEALHKINAAISYESLKNQVNPHFLFNSLTTISSMIDTDRAAAKQFLENMGQVYRYVLQSSKTPLVSFREELAFSMAWVNMMRERYHNRFRLETSVDAASLTKQLPPMSLQILVENIFKHNVLSSLDPLCIQISATGESLTVENDLMEKKVKVASTGTGLYNLDQRYQYLCGEGIRIEKQRHRFSVKLPLLQENHETEIRISAMKTGSHEYTDR